MAIVVAAAYLHDCDPCLLEFLQQWSAGRHPRVSDAVVGALAGMLGAGLSAWLRKGAEAHLNGRTRRKLTGA